jgi:hypothetical protein
MGLTHVFQRELNWLEEVIKLRIVFPEADPVHFDLEKFLSEFPNRSKIATEIKDRFNTSPPLLDAEENYVYSEIIKKCEFEERLLLILALSIHLEPGFINRILEQYHYSELIKKTSGFWSISGILADERFGILPTGRFWIYLLAGTDLKRRIALLSKLGKGSIHLITSGLVDIAASEETEPCYGGFLKIDQSVLNSLFSDID